ncbi:MerR family transcriptional regulator [Mesobacillus foraminis]|uniref:MerR family transcriptional regulator n=1 Tax=Mesobacillus foraminis TaxID=279826 RepID=UPI000EF52F16|nr:MerR family transcriptional regulator [Mesobacillus foraminis]
MKEKLYSIGDISRLANVSIKALRYYDKIDLFKPAYIDPDTNYRYYRDSQLYHLDLIKSLKYIGTPLEEIRLAQELDSEELMKFLEKQEKQVREKIDFLLNIEQSITNVKKGMQRQLEYPSLGEVYVVEEEEIRIIRMEAEGMEPESLFNASYSKLKMLIESTDGFTNTSYGAMFHFEHYANLKDISYIYLFSPVLSKNQISAVTPDFELTTIPKGKYICIAFHFSPENYLRNLQKLTKYVGDHQFQPISDIFEFFIPIHYSPKKQEEFRVEMRVRVAGTGEKPKKK